MEDGAGTICWENRGFLSAGGTRPGASAEQSAAPGTHAFSPGCVAKGQACPHHPMDIYFLIPESF